MAVYQISYDLQNPGQDYEDLYDGIKNLGSWTHILESTWLVDCDVDSAGDVRDELKPKIDANDKLFVTKISDGWSWGTSFSDDSTSWIQEHLG